MPGTLRSPPNSPLQGSTLSGWVLTVSQLLTFRYPIRSSKESVKTISHHQGDPMRLLAGLIGRVLATSGCATVVWEKLGVTQAQFNIESNDCIMRAESGASAALAMNAFVGSASRQRIFDACMRSKGWAQQVS
jgi:hypothetical protein